MKKNKIIYDTHYKTENLFGEAYPELLAYYSQVVDKTKLLDVGCGQGRDAIPLAKLGFLVTGIDHSQVGIDQLNEIAEKDNLSLKGVVKDIYSYSDFNQYDFILLDSMFHFGKREREKEINFLNRLLTESKLDTIITICISKSGKKLEILNTLISSRKDLEITNQTELIYKYNDKASNHTSETKYQMLHLKKIMD